VSVVDRGRPVASCSEWHGDGTAGERDGASHLVAEAQAWRMGEARPRMTTCLVWQGPAGPRQAQLDGRPDQPDLVAEAWHGLARRNH
jgi:hypothetical protein